MASMSKSSQYGAERSLFKRSKVFMTVSAGGCCIDDGCDCPFSLFFDADTGNRSGSVAMNWTMYFIRINLRLALATAPFLSVEVDSLSPVGEADPASEPCS